MVVVVVVVAFIYSRLLNRHKTSTSRVPTGEGEGVTMSCGGRGEREEVYSTLQYGESLLTLTQRIANSRCWAEFGEQRRYFRYCNFTNFRCVKISVTSDHGAFGKV